MNVTIYPSSLRGRIILPPSKSHVHRLLMAAAMCDEETVILCPGENEDIQATIRCLQALNARIRREGDRIIVRGPLGYSEHMALDCGESGSTLRFLLPLCAVHGDGRDIVLMGRGRLPKRPNGALLSEMARHGAVIRRTEEAEQAGNELPLVLSGGMQPGDYYLPGNVSSQYFTGLLFALPLLPGDSTLRFTSYLESMPYVDLTLSVLAQFGIRVEKLEDGWHIPGNQRYHSPGNAEAEGDWSAAAFWEGANALGSHVQYDGAREESPQGDKKIRELLKKIGGDMDVTDTPDLMPILSAVAAATPGKTVISGAARLRIKESDRLSAMAKTIRALGGCAEEREDGLIIEGKALSGGVVDGMNDHRVVMSAAIAATACEGPVTILGAEAVQKSYPGFFEDFVRLGGIVDVR